MADEKYTFEQARVRLEEIATEVRKKDTSLERSLDLLEEGVRLANICTELVDHVDFDEPAAGEASSAEVGSGEIGDDAADRAVPAHQEAGTDVEAAATREDETEGFEDADEALDEPVDAGGDD